MLILIFFEGCKVLVGTGSVVDEGVGLDTFPTFPVVTLLGSADNLLT